MQSHLENIMQNCIVYIVKRTTRDYFKPPIKFQNVTYHMLNNVNEDKRTNVVFCRIILPPGIKQDFTKKCFQQGKTLVFKYRESFQANPE